MIKRSVLITAILLGGCSTTAYKDEVDKLGTAAVALSASVPSRNQINDASTTVIDPVLDILMAGGKLSYTEDCARDAKAAQDALVASLSGSDAAQDAALARFKTIKPCELVSMAPPKAEKPKSTTKPKDKDAAEKEKKAAEEKQKAEAELQAILDARAKNPAPIDPDADPICNGGSCNLENYLGLISSYGENLKTIADSKSTEGIDKALDGAGKSITGLAEEAKLGSPILTAIVNAGATIAKLSIQQAQFNAMRAATLDFDANWVKVAPAVRKAARLRYAELAVDRAASSEQAAKAASEYLNDERYYRSPAERLALYNLMNGRVSVAASALRSAQASDPSEALDGFTKASHELALAIIDPKKQRGALSDALKALQEQIEALQKAAKPAAAKGKE